MGLIARAINQARYRDRNKLFANFKSGDLIRISLDTSYTNKCKARSITKNNKGKFAYSQAATFPRKQDFCTWVSNDQVGLYLGRYDGYAVVLINEGLCAIAVDSIKKVEGNNG